MNKRIAKKQLKRAQKEKTAINKLEVYERALMRKGTIASNLRRGKTEKTYDAYTHQGAFAAFILNQEVVEPLLRNKSMLDLMTRNAEKLKHKMTHTVNVRGIDHAGREHTICTYQLNGHHSIQEAIQHSTELFKKDRTVQGSSAKNKITQKIEAATRGQAPIWTTGDTWTPKSIIITTTLRV